MIMYYDDKVSRGNVLSRDLKFLVISESERGVRRLIYIGLT